ncbi:hypothetical protein N7462_010085 [Penicillium macrosclerotiorum]|uniref:uncharacterized protein n=1 Tax=Penicillium macrosclerotiorum TaxID=303699 RepID=UPI0025488031|nr:uncharacterized protein N7462_010085 [Penicillium macrosclerotiorum]KAJ5669015.1 hypothetical protein N7462_010085 [Penicillium macrosclerotiorum]
MPKWYHLQDNNCQHFVLNLADKILRDPRNKYVVLKGEFISAGGTEAQRSEPAKDEQDFKEEEDFEEEDVVPIVNRDAEGAFIENEEDRRKAMLGSIAEFMVANTPSIQESEAVHQ